MKKALVTGGAGGIGEAICQRLAADGYFVYVNYAHSAEKAKRRGHRWRSGLLRCFGR